MREDTKLAELERRASVEGDIHTHIAAISTGARHRPEKAMRILRSGPLYFKSPTPLQRQALTELNKLLPGHYLNSQNFTEDRYNRSVLRRDHAIPVTEIVGTLRLVLLEHGVTMPLAVDDPDWVDREATVNYPVLKNRHGLYLLSFHENILDYVTTMTAMGREHHYLGNQHLNSKLERTITALDGKLVQYADLMKYPSINDLKRKRSVRIWGDQLNDSTQYEEALLDGYHSLKSRRSPGLENYCEVYPIGVSAP
jgi:hypothetical protein